MKNENINFSVYERCLVRTIRKMQFMEVIALTAQLEKFTFSFQMVSYRRPFDNFIACCHICNLSHGL